MKLVGISGEAAAYTGSRPLSNHAWPGRIVRGGSSPTLSSSAPAIRQRIPPPWWVRQRDAPRVEVDAVAAHQVLRAGLELDRLLEERLGGGVRYDVRPALACTPQELP